MESNLKGLNIVYDFISQDEENSILDNLSDIKYQVGKKRGGRSSIKRFGSSQPYNNFMANKEIPYFLNQLSKKIIEKNYLTEIPDHVTVNVYEVGDYVAPHIDSKESGEVITILSLLSDCEMVLNKGNEKILLPLPKRSLIQLSGEFRWDWKHSILPVTKLRYSLVFRNSNRT